jgi:ABC-type branched-subunit amino acid transport system ATPase component
MLNNLQKKTTTAPVIVEEFTNDNAEQCYILENGNTVLKEKYDAMWKPQKGKIKPRNYREDIDGRRNWS